MTIQDTIDNVLEQKNNEPRKEQTTFHVGALSGCLRGAYLARKGEKGIPLSPQKLRVFQMGNLVEEFVEQCLDKSGQMIDKQGRLEWPELGLSGRFDFVTKDDERGVGVRECKSVHSRSFHWQKKRGGKPSDGKIMQVALYWDKLKETYPGMYASVIDVSKDDLSIMEYVVPLDELIAYSKKGKENAAILNECWKNGELPPVPPTIIEEFGKRKINWVAQYCGLHHLCMGDDHWEDIAKQDL